MDEVLEAMFLREKWEDSYARKENYLFYPKEEHVKFLNRFVRKRVGVRQFENILPCEQAGTLKGLDYGCGIGRLTILLREFGLDAYGVDISRNAIEQAKELARCLGFMDLAECFLVVDGKDIPFDDSFFDVTLCEAVLDHMLFDQAIVCLKEIERVTKRYAFISLISGEDHLHERGYSGEEIVEGGHEHGTVQSYYNREKIENLVAATGFSIGWWHMIRDQSILDRYESSRFYILLEKGM